MLKSRLTLLLLLLSYVIGSSQTNPNGLLLRSTLGKSCPTKSTLSNAFYVQQSIGQASVIGTTVAENGMVLRQGYLQPNVKGPFRNQSSNLFSATTLIYPNPFNQKIHINFEEKITTNIDVKIFDVFGKQVFEREYEAQQELELAASNVPEAAYFLYITANKKAISKKLLKKE
ncbi:MAG: T9SS type A sorting domain-containing protein [Flavobacterium sp.]|nr:T9SS type A sorting domain-containing protein [Flavobacterium sp.]MBL0013647.1 T9SS type A sorting domain-containing protein [Flavobacterium sp.]